MNPILSVVIPTYKRPIYLEDAIHSVYENDVDKGLFEVIVVDNDSKDETELLCKSFQQNFDNFHYYNEPTNGLLFARHKGLEVAQGEVLLFLDDDVLVSKQLLQRILEIFQKDSSIFVASGNVNPQWEATTPDWVFSLWKHNQYGKTLSELSLIDFQEYKGEIESGYSYGCNLAVRKSFLLDCGGFHPDGFSKNNLIWRGDGEMAVAKSVQQYGGKVFFDNQMAVTHRIPKERLTVEYLCSRSFAQGISYSYGLLREKKHNSVGSILYYQLKGMVCYSRALMIRTKIFREMRKSFIKGWLAHLKEYQRNAKLREWVHRENYFGCDMSKYL